MEYLIHYISDADNDLDEIHDYILKNYYSEEIALSTVQKIVKGIQHLKTFPEIGVSLDKKLQRKINSSVEVRMLILDSYLVFYFIKENEVFILRILRSDRDYMRFLHSFSALLDKANTKSKEELDELS